MALRQKQQREQQSAHINSMKIHNQWRKIMRVAKVEELRGEVEILSQNHEREVDRKDALVQVCCLLWLGKWTACWHEVDKAHSWGSCTQHCSRCQFKTKIPPAALWDTVVEPCLSCMAGCRVY